MGDDPGTVRPNREVASATVIRIPPQRGGWLEVVCGPMFSGKSEEMIRRLRRAEIAGQRVVIFKPRIDDRYDATDVVSHAGARMRAVAVESVPELVARSAGHDVVGIDEVQFFEREVVERRSSLADGGVRVVVAGLARTSAGCRSGRCPSCSPARSSSTSCRPSATAAAARPRRRSGSSTAGPRPTRARRSSSARSTRTRRAVGTATKRESRRSRSCATDGCVVCCCLRGDI